jgi:hypothetical protein
MKCILSGLFVTLMALGGGTCNSDIPLQWVINPLYVDNVTPNAFQGDGNPYINGQSGVTTIINICSATGDATLSLGSGHGATRTSSVSFARVLATTSATPSWAASGSTVSQWGANIHDIMCFRCAGPIDNSQEYQFTTTFTSNMQLFMWNPTSQAARPDNLTTPNINSPYADSLVNVYHCPANSTSTTGRCVGVVHETWLVWPDPNPTASGTSQAGWPITQVMSLVVSKGNQYLNAGEFSIPFYFVISRLR